MVELLDSLLGGSGSECSWDADAPLWTLPQEADAPPPVAAPLPLGWRCICPAHGAPCARGCAPAPDEAAEVCFALVGETTGQNGVKALRALVVATPEWRDARTRLRLAAEWERSSGSRAALATLRSPRRCEPAPPQRCGARTCWRCAAHDALPARCGDASRRSRRGAGHGRLLKRSRSPPSLPPPRRSRRPSARPTSRPGSRRWGRRTNQGCGLSKLTPSLSLQLRPQRTWMPRTPRSSRCSPAYATVVLRCCACRPPQLSAGARRASVTLALRPPGPYCRQAAWP